MTSFPLSSTLCEQFSAANPGHTPQQAKALPLAVWSQLGVLGQAQSTVATLARLVARVLIADLRFAHVGRAELSLERSNDRLQVWRVSKGKKKNREPFMIGLPTHIGPNQPMFTELHNEMEAILPQHARTIMMPDVVVSDVLASAQFVPQPMTYNRFVVLVRQLCSFPPLALSSDELDAVSTYSLQRWLPSIADGLQLKPEERASLGNWQDSVGQPVREPMHVRYSEVRLESSAQARRLCISAVAHLLRHVPNATMMQVTSVAKFLDKFRASTTSSSWGAFVQDGNKVKLDCPPPEDNKAVDRPESMSSTSSESSQDSDGENAETSTVDSFRWLAPKNGLVHVQKDELLLMPCCKKLEFKVGCDQGVGVASAFLTGKQFCPTCVTTVPGLAHRVFSD